MLQFSWTGILKILKEIHLHWNKSGETNVTFNCSPWGYLCVPWQSSMPEHLPHCLPFLNDSYALCPAQRPPLVPLLPTFFPQHLQRWRWQVFMGGAAVPARWSPSNCCLPLLFCAEGLWRQHLLYESWGWVLCCPACYASTLRSVHAGRCPVACLCCPQCYGDDLSCVQCWVSERWLRRHSFCFVRYFATFLDSPMNAAHSSGY